MPSYQKFTLVALLATSGLVATPAPGATPSLPPASNFTLRQVLNYPFPSDLTGSRSGNRIAWLINLRGRRNVWVAEAPDFTPRQVTHFTRDDGQEITQLTFSPRGDELVFVRGGDHDANWPDQVPADPASSPVEPKVMLWTVDLHSDTAHALISGDAPAISAAGRLAYVKDGQVWTASLDPHAKPQPHRLFFDHGQDEDLHWSPNGKRLAFVSNRGNHAFVGVYTNDSTPIMYLAPSTHIDGMPRWSPSGSRIAFIRQPGSGGPQPAFPFFARTPEPWSIMVADATSGHAHMVWHSPESETGTLLLTFGEADLHWADHGKRLAFVSDMDGWQHLYSITANGGTPLLLTPGKFMVQDVALSRDGHSLVYVANAGTSHNDQDRRHLFTVPVARAQPVELTAGRGLQWSPRVAGGNAIAYIEAGAKHPPQVAVMSNGGSHQRTLQPQLLPQQFPTAQLLIPKAVTFKAADGTLIHGQLFRSETARLKQPGVIFVHGGPPRQMLLGWHPMGAYSSMYAVNQYLATHGFTVLSVNYRLSVGYGHAFANPPHAGPTGASEYQDVVAGAKFLQRLPGVDATRIGIWGASYGGYLTALALARNSDIFKAGVDMLGVHNWTLSLGPLLSSNPASAGYQQNGYKKALKVAWESSPDASIATWKSPVLLIQGDDDHNVHFAQMEDVVHRLRKHQVPYEEMVIPNEVHDFRRYVSWLNAYRATVHFLQRELGHN